MLIANFRTVFGDDDGDADDDDGDDDDDDGDDDNFPYNSYDWSHLRCGTQPRHCCWGLLIP